MTIGFEHPSHPGYLNKGQRVDIVCVPKGSIVEYKGLLHSVDSDTGYVTKLCSEERYVLPFFNAPVVIRTLPAGFESKPITKKELAGAFAGARAEFARSILTEGRSINSKKLLLLKEVQL